MVKKIQSETVIKKKKRINSIYSESTSYQDNWIDNDVHKLSNLTKEEKIKKAQLLVNWAVECDKAYAIEQWCIYLGRMDDTTLYKWSEEIPEVKYLVDQAKKAIGLRREFQAIGADDKRKLDAPHVMRYLHQWLPRYKKHEEFMAELSKKDEQVPTKIEVVLERYPQSPLVKDKKDEDL